MWAMQQVHAAAQATNLEAFSRTETLKTRDITDPVAAMLASM